MAIINHIDFVFKLSLSEEKKPQLCKNYPIEAEFDGIDTFLIPFSEAETRMLPDGGNIYWDVRPVTHDGKILNTGVPKCFKMAPTLFSGGDDGA